MIEEDWTLINIRIMKNTFRGFYYFTVDTEKEVDQ